MAYKKPSGAKIYTEKKADYIQLTTLQILKKLVIDKFWKQQELYINEPPKDIDVHHIAVILDGKVYEILRAQDKLADMFLAQPTFVKFEPEDGVHIGLLYADGEFKHEETAS
jgi:hypothetical protein